MIAIHWRDEADALTLLNEWGKCRLARVALIAVAEQLITITGV